MKLCIHSFHIFLWRYVMLVVSIHDLFGIMMEKYQMERRQRTKYVKTKSTDSNDCNQVTNKNKMLKLLIFLRD